MSQFQMSFDVKTKLKEVASVWSESKGKRC